MSLGPIGGFPQAELLLHPQSGEVYHHGALLLTSGRSALLAILKQLQPSLVYIPYYICDVVIRVFEESRIPYRFYALDKNLLPKEAPKLEEREFLLYPDYWGCCFSQVLEMSAKYGNRLIVDASQSFFLKYEDIASRGYLFNSVRKFFGAPDGGYVYGLEFSPPTERNRDFLLEHLICPKGPEGSAYRYFLENEGKISSFYIAASAWTEHLLSRLNYEKIAAQRRENFRFYHAKLASYNQLHIVEEPQPGLCYPLLLQGNVESLKKCFVAKNIFIPSYWQDCVVRELSTEFSFECELSQRLLPLPIAHNYDEATLEFVIDTLFESMECLKT